jgi:outer membrane protein assembly factor BamB
VPLGGSYWWSALAYDNGQLFALNTSGQLQAFDPATGARTWTTQLPGQSSFTSPPTAVGGYVYTAGSGAGGTLYAVDESTGALSWAAAVMNGANSSPVVTASGVYVSYACDQTYDFNPTTGALVWHYATSCEGGGGRTPALAGGQLYVRDPTLGDVILDASSGTLLGTFTAGPVPAFSGSSGYFLNGSTLSAQSTTDQATQWTFSGDGSLDTAPVVANGVVYEGSGTGQLYALSGSTGSVLWSGNAGRPIPSPDEQNVSQPLTGMAVSGGMLVVPTTNTLVAYTTAPTPPSAPQNLTASAGNGQVALSWTAPASSGGTPVEGYDVYMGSAPGAESPTPVNSSLLTGTSTTVTGLSNGTTYYFTVEAVNAVGNSPSSNETSAKPMAPTVPGPPQNLKAVTDPSKGVDLSWTAPATNGGSPVTAYTVFRGTKSGRESAYASIRCSTSCPTSFHDSNTKGATTYFYEIAAVNSVGTGPTSNEASAKAK